MIQGLRLGARQIVGVDLNDDRRGEQFGMTDFVNPVAVSGDLTAHLIEVTGGGADYTFECIAIQMMRVALESAHKGWGESIIIGVAVQVKVNRPFQLVTAGLARDSFWREGVARMCRKSWTGMDGQLKLTR